MLEMLLYKFIEDDSLFLPPVPDKQHVLELEVFICNYKFFVSQKKNLRHFLSNTSIQLLFPFFADDATETRLQRKT